MAHSDVCVLDDCYDILVNEHSYHENIIAFQVQYQMMYHSPMRIDFHHFLKVFRSINSFTIYISNIAFQRNTLEFQINPFPYDEVMQLFECQEIGPLSDENDYEYAQRLPRRRAFETTQEYVKRINSEGDHIVVGTIDSTLAILPNCSTQEIAPSTIGNLEDVIHLPLLREKGVGPLVLVDKSTHSIRCAYDLFGDVDAISFSKVVFQNPAADHSIAKRIGRKPGDYSFDLAGPPPYLLDFLLYAPPHSGKSTFNDGLYADTDSFESWYDASHLVITNLHRLIPYSKRSISVLPSKKVFLRRCEMRSLKTQECWYQDAVNSSRSASIVILSDRYLSEVLS